MITMKLDGSNLATSAFLNITKDVKDKKTMVKEVILPAAKIVKKVMIGMAPILSSPVFNVYRTPKAKAGMRAPNGMGKIYVAIKQGQLKKSISYFHTKATRNAGAINIGPRYKKGIWKKPEKGGWYMHMVQFGTDSVKAQPFVLPALLATKKGVANMMEIGMNKRLKRIVAKDGNGVITIS
tara:strand:+ start:4693 stop:5235 length:543 start_codon:yes stop_codon:yes gene_type:complete